MDRIHSRITNTNLSDGTGALLSPLDTLCGGIAHFTGCPGEIILRWQLLLHRGALGASAPYITQKPTCDVTTGRFHCIINPVEGERFLVQRKNYFGQDVWIFRTIFVQKPERKKKTGAKASEFKKYSLTNRVGCDTMIFHTVILCLFRAILPNMVILPHMGFAVKWKVR